MHQTANSYDSQGVSTISTTESTNFNAIALLELKIKTLKTALHDLQVEIESLGKQSDASGGDDGRDFYEEVRRFEIYLIERALVQAKGVQKEAAKILKMRTSTLNQKIKLYNISPKYYAFDSSNSQGNAEERRKLSA